MDVDAAETVDTEARLLKVEDEETVEMLELESCRCAAYACDC